MRPLKQSLGVFIGIAGAGLILNNEKLIEILEDGSAKTFIYEDPEKKNKSSFIARIKAKIQQKLRPSAN
jgi:hypothetical protein